MEMLLNPMFIAMAAGILGGALASTWLGSFIYNRAILEIKGWSNRRLRIAKVIAGSVAVIAVPLSFFLAFVVGGNLGGGIGEALGIGAAGIPVSLGLGLAAVFIVTETAAIFLGLLLAAGISRLAA
ncbi:MAG: hypothetical protein ACYC1T_15860 [Sulfuricaulis sp.]